MLVAVIISHRLSPRATAQFGAEGKCSENILATMRSEAIRNKPATRNRMVRMRPILRTEVDGTCGAPNTKAERRRDLSRRPSLAFVRHRPDRPPFTALACTAGQRQQSGDLYRTFLAQRWQHQDRTD